MFVTIINEDKYVSVDGIGYSGLSFNIPDNISAIQWKDNEGEVEYTEVNKHKPQNTVITSIEEFNGAIQAWQIKHDSVLNPPSPSEQELLNLCKGKAKTLLQLTDWAVLSDVSLVNKAEFEAYRSTVRAFIIQPVINPVFPEAPQAIWAPSGGGVYQGNNSSSANLVE